MHRIFILLIVMVVLTVSACERGRQKGAKVEQSKRTEAPKEANLKKVESELKKVEEALGRATEVGAQLRLLWPAYKRFATFERDTSPDLAVVLSGFDRGRKRSDTKQVQKAMFHMSNIVKENRLAFTSSRTAILEHASQTHQATAPVVEQILDLYEKSLEESQDCRKLMQQSQHGDWWCIQDPDFQNYVDRYFLNVSEAYENRCFIIQDAVRTVCGTAYATTAKANELYSSQ